jgi:hypothetical protein
MKPGNHDPSALELLWLDFDGVLHPCPLPETKRDSGRYEAELFQSADVLAEMLRPYPAVRLVLSTSWVLSYGLDRTRKLLPNELAQRVIGATFDEKSMDRYEFGEMPRHEQIIRDVAKRQPIRWLALDDDADDWPAGSLDNLVPMPSELGLSCEVARTETIRALTKTFGF